MKNLTRAILLAILVALPLTVLAADAAPPATQPAAAPAAVAATAPAAAPAPPAPAEPAKAVPEEKAPVGAAEAPAEGTQKWWQGLLVTVIEGVVAIAMPILSLLLMILIRKWNLKIEQEKVDWVLRKSLGYGEQKAKVALKDGSPMEGPAIAKAAVEHGTALLEKYGLAKKFGGWLADGIEAKLGEGVIEAGGAKKVVNGAAPKPVEG